MGTLAKAVVTLVCVLLVGAGAFADDATKCEAAKLKLASQYGACRLKAESKAVKKGAMPDFMKCDSKVSQKWTDAETKGGGLCPTNGDLASMQARITGDADDIALLLSGGVLPPTAVCGNGIIEGTEDCEVGDLNGADCTTEGFAGGVLACAAGCAYDTSACWASRFVDNGDGTSTDNETGLMWEQKDDAGGIHDKDQSYTWSASGTLPDGSVFTTFLGTLNNGTSADGTAISGCFAGHCDWRLPTIAELQTVLECGWGPCSFGLPQGFCWSGNTFGGGLVWIADLYLGEVARGAETDPYNARAVRGGS